MRWLTDEPRHFHVDDDHDDWIDECHVRRDAN
jgi:hypothetical protein